MKDLFKKIYEGIIKLFDTFSSVIDVICFGRLFIKKPHFERQSESAVVLANGPSAKEIINEKPHLLANCDIVAMNDNALSDFFVRLKPRYYVLLDPAYFDGAFHSDNEVTRNDYNKVVDELYKKLQKVNWEMLFFLPSIKIADPVANAFKDHKFVKIARYNKSRIQGFNGYKMLALRYNLGVPSSKNIIIPALLQMVNMGYKTIYLYGAEFSWTKTMDIDVDNGMLFLNDKHFYNKEEVRYYGKGAYQSKLESIAEALRGLEVVAEYASKLGIKIVNRTKGSFIDAFDYQNPDNI